LKLRDIHPPPPAKKYWLRSRTIWLNTLVAVLLAAEESVHIVQPVVGDSFYMLTSFALVLINVALRSVTTTALVSNDD